MIDSTLNATDTETGQIELKFLVHDFVPFALSTCDPSRGNFHVDVAYATSPRIVLLAPALRHTRNRLRQPSRKISTCSSAPRLSLSRPVFISDSILAEELLPVVYRRAEKTQEEVTSGGTCARDTLPRRRGVSVSFTAAIYHGCSEAKHEASVRTHARTHTCHARTRSCDVAEAPDDFKSD